MRPLDTVESFGIRMPFVSVERGILDFVPATTTQDQTISSALGPKNVPSNVFQRKKSSLLPCSHYFEGHPKVRKEDCAEQSQDDEAEVGSNLDGNHVCRAYTAVKRLKELEGRFDSLELALWAFGAVGCVWEPSRYWNLDARWLASRNRALGWTPNRPWDSGSIGTRRESS